MDERDLVPCPGRPGVLIERRDLHQPTRLEHTCECGVVVGWPEVTEHRCDFTATDPDDDACDTCGRYSINGRRDTFICIDRGRSIYMETYCSAECWEIAQAEALPLELAHPRRPA